MKLAVVIGHKDVQRGAQMSAPFSFLSEYDFNKVLGAIVYMFAKDKGIDCKIFFRDGKTIPQAYEDVNNWKPDCSIELHFNWFEKPAYGTSTLYGNKPGAQKLAELVQQEMVITLGREGKTNRGIKLMKKGDRGDLSVNHIYKFPSVLIEPFFGSEPSECELGLTQMHLLASCLVDAVFEYLN